jgi:hypothetical protein
MWQKVACHVKLPGEHYNTSIVSGSPRSQQIKAVVFFFFVPGRSGSGGSFAPGGVPPTW